jgi:DNA-binding transcriptional MerR regulator
MKKSLIPKYLKDEIRNLVKKKPTYTKEEIDQVMRDMDHVKEQRAQLAEAEKYHAMPDEEAKITGLVLLVKQFVLQETIKDVIRFLKEDEKRIEEEIKRLKQTY